MNVAKIIGDSHLMWKCEGCDDLHCVPVEGERKWDWNGSLTAPTLMPSVRVTLALPNETRICHLWMKHGQVEFLKDSTHALAGQTRPMLELTEDD